MINLQVPPKSESSKKREGGPRGSGPRILAQNTVFLAARFSCMVLGWTRPPHLTCTELGAPVLVPAHQTKQNKCLTDTSGFYEVAVAWGGVLRHSTRCLGAPAPWAVPKPCTKNAQAYCLGKQYFAPTISGQIPGSHLLTARGTRTPHTPLLLTLAHGPEAACGGAVHDDLQESGGAGEPAPALTK